MNETHQTVDNPTDASTIQTRLSNEQKALLQRLVNDHQNPEDAPNSHYYKQMWSKIATQLNEVPGAQKSWMQWRKTWNDIQKNSSDLKSEKLFDYGTFVADHEFSISQDIVDNEMSMDSVEKDDDGDDEEQEIVGDMKRQRAKNISKTQRKLLYTLVNSNESLHKEKSDGTGPSYLIKQKEWKKIAVKLNSVTGPQKTWSQWNKCWHNIQKYYVRRDAVAKIFDSETDDVNVIVDGDLAAFNYRRRKCKKSGNTPSATQLNCRDKNGPSNERIKVERSKNIRRDSNHQLQLLQRTADKECSIVGSLVAVKLRSMQKEQKLIAEKLISEILFQGQMEMFKYSDQAVNIAGYMQ